MKKKKTISLSTIHSILQTILLCIILCRVQAIHHRLAEISASLQQVSSLFQKITAEVLTQLEYAKLQFAASIESILSIFGQGDGA